MAQQVIKIVKETVYSIVIDGAKTPLTPETAIELIKAQGFAKTELDLTGTVNVEGTQFSYKPNVAIFYDGKNLNLPPQTCQIMTLLLNNYIQSNNQTTTDDLINYLVKRGYKEMYSDTLYARIGDLNKTLKVHTGKKVILNKGQGYYYLDFTSVD